MSIIGLAVALSLNVDHALNTLEKENVVMVFFDDRNAALYGNSNPVDKDNSQTNGETYNDISENDYTIHSYEDALILCSKIEKLENIASVKYFSGDDALKNTLSSMTEEQVKYYTDLLDSDEYGNPMPCGAKVSFISLESFDDTLKSVEELEGVDHTYSTRDIANKITLLNKAVGIIGFWIVAILMIIALMIVSNTIRVTMYSRKLEIGIMKAVGATDSFVRLPFMIEGITIGLLSAVITLIVLYFVYNAVEGTVSNVLNITNLIPFSDFAWRVSVIFIGIGCFAGLFSSAFMINKYLKKEGSEFRAL